MTEPDGAVTGLVGRVLQFMDKPWKAAAIVVLLILCGTGWIVYDKRDELFDAWMAPGRAALKVADVPDALVKLVAETNADLVQIWEVDLVSNSQWFVGARRNDGERPVVPSPRRLPIMDHASDIRQLIGVLEGHSACLDLTATGTPVSRRLAEHGMARGCAIPIQPNPDAFVGVIYLAWAKRTDESNENVAVGAARVIAVKLVTQ